ncbi:MAG: sugar O-acetyltransferase [Bacilli bacterium]|jgi:maltose O-acetyltransferase|nr:sugar O-acetyltransferase [Bacilli bacterium]
MKQTEKMLKGELYNSGVSELIEMKIKEQELLYEFNHLHPKETSERIRLLHLIFPHLGANAWMEQSLKVEYGVNTTIGDNFYANFDCKFHDICPIKIGDNVMFGPNVIIATPMHPLLAEERNPQQFLDGFYNIEYGKPITIGSGVWLAAGVIVCGGVTIGDDVVIGAGSVVTHDIPSHSLAAGVPCKVIRPLNEKDKMFSIDERNKCHTD